MNPSFRLLQVMEYLMSAGAEPVRQVDMARQLEIAPATLSRIIKTLSERGYVLRTRDKLCVRNFHLARNVPMSERYLVVLRDLMNDITQRHRMSVEAVVVSGFDLLWHARTELPNATVKIQAMAGYRRSLYELDAMSRLYLSRIGWDDVRYRFNAGGFFATGLDMKAVSEAQARRVIDKDRESNFDYDFDGNHVGVRRFATIVEDEAGNFLHLLSLAEAALPVRDKAEKIESCRAILTQARAVLQAQTRAEAASSRSEKKHELHPARIG